jgi:ubiquinol-cytochrome c reductase cytochrome b subunit
VLVKDAVAAVVVLGALYLLAWRFPPEIGEIADPTDASFNPRPEWYFLWLFQLLKYFPGRLEVVGAVVLPTIAVLALIALPFVDRSRMRHPMDRRTASAAALAGVVAIIGLTVAGARSPLVSAYVPLPPSVATGARIYRELHCDSCHGVFGRGGMVGPDLALDVPARDGLWMRAHFQSPSSVVPGSPMPAFGLLEDEVDALVAYLDEVRGGGPPSERAPRLYRRYCSECHALAGRGGDKGPNLDGIGGARTRSFIHRYIEDPKSLLTNSRMPVMLAPEGPLSHEQIEDISRFLAALREPAPVPRPAQEDADDGS